MRKIGFVLAVASIGFVACNNNAENKPGEDSVTVTSEPAPTPAIDTLAAKVDSAKDDTSVGAKIDSAMAH